MKAGYPSGTESRQKGLRRIPLPIQSWEEETFQPSLEVRSLARVPAWIHPDEIEAIGAADDAMRFRPDLAWPDAITPEDSDPRDPLSVDCCPADI